MATPFADLMAKANNAVKDRLFDATATINGSAVPGIFSNDYAEFNGVIGGSDPTFLCKTEDVAGVNNGTAVTINSTAYTVAGAPQPDGSGLTLLQLREA